MAALSLSAPRIEGVDVARALAAATMIVGHANDAWVSDAGKGTLAYAAIELLQSLPLPAFLVLAGASVVLRIEAGIRREERAREVRRSIVRRGLTIVAYGYLVSLAYALIDGAHGLDTLLRADVLHVIGLSIAALGLCARGRGGPERRPLWGGALLLSIVPIALSPWLSPLGAEVQGPLRFGAALFVDVAPVTRMPFVPLVSWVAIGALTTLAMLRTPSRGRAGGSVGFFVALAIGGAMVAAGAFAGMHLMLGALGGSLSRAHPAVWLNAIDLAARGLVVLAVGALLSLVIPDRARAPVVRFGRGSLVAYVVHIPFCYGRPGAWLRGSLEPGAASALAAGLIALAWLAVWGRDLVVTRLAIAR